MLNCCFRETFVNTLPGFCNVNWVSVSWTGINESYRAEVKLKVVVPCQRMLTININMFHSILLD